MATAVTEILGVGAVTLAVAEVTEVIPILGAGATTLAVALATAVTLMLGTGAVTAAVAVETLVTLIDGVGAETEAVALDVRGPTSISNVGETPVDAVAFATAATEVIVAFGCNDIAPV